MTGIRNFKATFKDLAAAVGLNYHEMKRGKLVVDLPRLQSGDVGQVSITRRHLCMVHKED